MKNLFLTVILFLSLYGVSLAGTSCPQEVWMGNEDRFVYTAEKRNASGPDNVEQMWVAWVVCTAGCTGVSPTHYWWEGDGTPTWTTTETWNRMASVNTTDNKGFHVLSMTPTNSTINPSGNTMTVLFCEDTDATGDTSTAVDCDGDTVQSSCAVHVNASARSTFNASTDTVNMGQVEGTDATDYFDSLVVNIPTASTHD